MRSYGIDRSFGDYSLSFGVVWEMSNESDLRLNLGRSFRLPTANELSANGVHHGSFRHERGDTNLDSERGWQLDLAYGFQNDFLRVDVSPFVSLYSNYIYQQPTLEWSILPESGQIYSFSQTKALFFGGEVSLDLQLPLGFGVNSAFEYTYTYNIEEKIPLTFSPPTTLLSGVSWESEGVKLEFYCRFIADQNRISRNENPTPGANLFGAKAIIKLPFISHGAMAVLSVDNIFNELYLNHMSYYRTVEIPEPGRNFQLSLKIPFKL